MRSTVTLLFLLLWGNLAISLSQHVCSAPPVVPHASVSEDSKKPQYLQGDVIYYTCETGYTSGPSIKYICSTEGWLVIRNGKCALKQCQLPQEISNGRYELTRGDEFVFGSVIQYHCDDGYQMMSKETTRTCMLNGWSNRAPVCEPLSCEAPTVADGVTVKGSFDSEEPIRPGQFLSFSCDAEGKRLNGSSQLVCGKDGQWDHPFPVCEEIACKAKDVEPPLRAVGLPVVNNTANVGHTVEFYCEKGYAVVGAETIQCLQSGEWDHPFPTCSESCVVRNLPQNVKITSRGVQQGDQLNPGQKIRFACTSSQQQIKGSAELTCLGQGQWSAAVPTCAAPPGPLRCPRPPNLADGDIDGTVKFSYSHNERVTYICQAFYIMENDQNTKTCTNGQWVGSVRCLRPCTVNREDMNTHNIQFQYKRDDKLYSTHKDFISFVCVEGRHHDGRVALRQQCIDGVMPLPTCT